LNGPVRSKGGSRYAGVLAHHEDRVVLVYEEYPRWGGPYWNIPSGRIEDHETPCEGACRELAEETGLVVATADLVLHGTAAVTGAATVSRVWNFTAEVVDPTLSIRDPDGLIQDVRWFPTEEASRLLRELPYRPLSEPSVAVLTRQAQRGAHWLYPDPEADPVVTYPNR
jgi:8-oxo-dGTP diphosphatase